MNLGFFGGLSASWWRSQHNRHHAMPQRLQHDVDLETMPFIAFNRRVVRNPKDGQNFFVRNQKFLFATLDTVLVSFYWKLVLHPRYMIKKRSFVDIGFVLAHYIYIIRILQVSFWQYLLIVWFGTTYMFTNFAMNHSHLPVADEPLH
jgi:fatty acid desaturase 2 (delta-6 desaturase)